MIQVIKNNPQFSLPATNLAVYVDKSGNDTTGTGSILQPYLTIVKALSTVTTSSTTNRVAIHVGSGRFDEVSNIIMKPYTYLIGQGRGATRITVTSATPLITINAACATGAVRVGMFGFTVSGNTNMSFPLQTLNPSSVDAFILEMNGVTHNNDFKWKGRSFIDQHVFHDVEFFQLNPGAIATPMEITVPSGTWKSCSFLPGGSANLNINDLGRVGSLGSNLSIWDTNIGNTLVINNTIADTIPSWMFYMYSSLPSAISITSAAVANPIEINMDDASIPQVQNITLVNSGRIVRLSGTSAINYTTSATLTAFAGGGQAGATPLPSDYNIGSIVASSNDSFLLPDAAKYFGQSGIKFKNTGANDADIFPTTGQSIDALAVNTAFSVSAGTTKEFIAISRTQWSTY